MEKFFEYVYMKDKNWEYIFPSPWGHLLFILIVSFFIFAISNGEKKDEVKRFNTDIVIDTTSYPAVEVNLNEVDIKETDFKISKSKHWSSKETNLPIGVVYKMDFAGSGTKKQTQSDNYVTIKRLDGSLSITRDIDVDLYLNLEKGDTIK